MIHTRSLEFIKATAILLAITAGSFYTLPLPAEAQSACTDQIAGKSRSQLEAELEACNKEIEQWTATLNATKNESASFSRDISALEAKINAAKSNINGKNIAISNLSKDIAKKEVVITNLDSQIERGKRSIADIIRKTSEIDSYSVVEALLSTQDFSNFFIDIDAYASTQHALDLLFDQLRGTKTLTESEKVALDKKRQAEAEAKSALEAAKKEVEVSQNEKKNLLALNQTKEKSYAQVLADRQSKAAQIKAVLFPLRDSGPIPFGTALQYAETAQAKTGVPPALVLAILKQESNLGSNVGTCVITNLTTGETKSVNSGKVFSNGIHPTRDLPLLQSLLNRLGRNPLETKVSCPLSIGYGGAMGPAQFIPSTWNIMEQKIASAVGTANPDPWNPAHAIMASSLFLGDIMGNTGDPFVDQRTAACRYYSGKTCYGSSGANVGLSYGNSVMNLASSIQADIDLIKLANN